MAGPGAEDTSEVPTASDVGFARDMAVHHQQAVEMSFIIRDRTDDEDVRRLAYWHCRWSCDAWAARGSSELRPLHSPSPRPDWRPSSAGRE
ncbi:hypothetical protein AS200_14145 [Streptomyces sp. CdTB01]|nr:hypothetical protein AS200_14145 [Streptomyces sp. CdTB01]